MVGFTKLFVDDLRHLPDGPEWTLARTFHEAIFKLELLQFEEVSLDHI